VTVINEDAAFQKKDRLVGVSTTRDLAAVVLRQRSSKVAFYNSANRRLGGFVQKLMHST
jgi:hypothetical protein